MTGREKKLREQRELVDVLRRRFTFAEIGKMVGATGVAVQFWSAGRYSARDTQLRRLREAAAQSTHVGFVASSTVLGREDRSHDEQSGLGAVANLEHVRTPKARARELRSLMERAGISGVEFAEKIGIISPTLYKYLDPNWPGTIAPDVRRRIASFRTALDGNRLLTAKDRLRIAVEAVVKRRSGVPKTVLAREVGDRSGVSSRTALRQMFPEQDWPRPNPQVLRELEKMAKELNAS